MLDYRESYGFVVVVVAVAHTHTYTHTLRHTHLEVVDKLWLLASGCAVLAQVKLMCIHLVNISKITPLGIVAGTRADTHIENARTQTRTHTHTF